MTLVIDFHDQLVVTGQRLDFIPTIRRIRTTDANIGPNLFHQSCKVS